MFRQKKSWAVRLRDVNGKVKSVSPAPLAMTLADYSFWLKLSGDGRLPVLHFGMTGMVQVSFS
jgi:hypothetical protein